MKTGKWTVQDRYGWGWSAYDPDGNPNAIEPLSTAHSVQVYCDARNEGKTHEEAWKLAKEAGGQTKAEWYNTL